MRTIQLPDTDEHGPPQRVRRLAFGPGGRELFAQCGDEASLVGFWWDVVADRETGRRNTYKGHFDYDAWPDAAVSADLALVVRAVVRGSLARDESLELLVRGQDARPRVLSPSMPGLGPFALSPDGRTLVATVGGTGQGWRFDVWDVARVLDRPRPGLRFADGCPPDRSLEREYEVGGLAFAPDGRAFAAGIPDGRVARWRLPASQLTSPLYAADPWYGERLAFDPTGTLLAGVTDTTVTVWDWASAGVRAELKSDWPLDAAFSPDGRRLAVGQSDGRVLVYDTAAWREVAAYAWGLKDVRAVAFAPDGLTCAAGAADGRIAVWDVGG